MGYTHYWRVLREPTESENEKLWEVCSKIVSVRSYILANGYGESSPEFTMKKDGGFELWLNGIAANDDHYETFAFPGNLGFNFCKTARRAYDEVVVAILIAIGVKDKESEELIIKGIKSINLIGSTIF